MTNQQPLHDTSKRLDETHQQIGMESADSSIFRTNVMFCSKPTQDMPRP